MSKPSQNGMGLSQNGGQGHDISSIVGNMVLAHELIVNDQYQLTSFKDNTLEKAVRDVVHKAFWDHLQEQLDHDPPLYENALQLLKEIKETILSLMLPQNEVLKNQINEVLDMELIAQEVSHNCFDLKECVKFIIIILSKLCAPIRDEEVKSLAQIEGTVPTLRAILELLGEMKLDMANFQLQQLKPYLMQQCVEYERGKFKEFLDANPDGTKITRMWLKTAISEVNTLITSSSRHSNGSQSPNNPQEESGRSSPEISNTLILTHAYLMLLDVADGWIAPETLLMDELRLAEMGYMFNRLALIGSVMLIVSNVVGQHLATDSAYVKKLKDDLFILLDGVSNTKLPNLLPNIFEQVLSETKKTTEERAINAVTPEQIELLKSQIVRILDGKNSVHRLIKSRVRDYVLLCMTSEKTSRHNEAPLALANVQEELKNLAGRFARLITHNRNVYQPFYNEMIKSILTEQASIKEDDKNKDETTIVSQ